MHSVQLGHQGTMWAEWGVLKMSLLRFVFIFFFPFLFFNSKRPLLLQGFCLLNNVAIGAKYALFTTGLEVKLKRFGYAKTHFFFTENCNCGL